MDYNIISAWAAIVAALTAVLAIWVEGKRSRFAQGLDLLQKMREEFDSEPFKKKRRTIAKILAKEQSGQVLTKKSELILKTAGTDILDHFQTIGILMRRGMLDEELVYSEYLFWVECYWLSLQRVYLAFEETDITVWEDAKWLYKRLKKFEKKLPPRGTIIELTHEDMEYFLRYESNLL